jgi:hypothetical protein
MNFELKDLFQFGLPSVLLALLLKQGLPFVRDWLVQFLTTIRDGFGQVEQGARERDERWRDLLSQIHRENREDRAEDQRLRQEMQTQFQAALRRWE